MRRLRPRATAQPQKRQPPRRHHRRTRQEPADVGPAHRRLARTEEPNRQDRVAAANQTAASRESEIVTAGSMPTEASIAVPLLAPLHVHALELTTYLDASPEVKLPVDRTQSKKWASRKRLKFARAPGQDRGGNGVPTLTSASTCDVTSRCQRVAVPRTLGGGARRHFIGQDHRQRTSLPSCPTRIPAQCAPYP